MAASFRSASQRPDIQRISQYLLAHVFTTAGKMQRCQGILARMYSCAVEQLARLLHDRSACCVRQQGSPPVRNAAAAAAKLGKNRGSTASMGALQSMSSLDGDNQYDPQYDTDTPAPLPLPQPTVHDVSGLLQHHSYMSSPMHAAV